MWPIHGGSLMRNCSDNFKKQEVLYTPLYRKANGLVSRSSSLRYSPSLSDLPRGRPNSVNLSTFGTDCRMTCLRAIGNHKANLYIVRFNKVPVGGFDDHSRLQRRWPKMLQQWAQN